MKMLIRTTLLASLLSLCAGVPLFAQTHTLQVQKTGDGSGEVRDCQSATECAGEQIACGLRCLSVYLDGESVLLKALPDDGSEFDGWLVNGEPPASQDIQMTQDVTVTVTFTLRPPVSGTLTMRFLEGVNLATGQTERDETLLAFGADAMTHTQDILLPNVPNLFDFGTSVTLHFEYRQAQMVLAPEDTVADMALLDTQTGGKAYADITDGDVTSFVFQSSAPQTMSPSQTVIVRRMDGRIYKLGQCALASDQWGVTCAYQELRP